MSQKQKERIAITGEGIVCAAGLDCAAVLQSLRERRSGVGPMHYLQSASHDLPVGEVKLTTEAMRHLLGIESENTGRTPLMGIMAIREALENAKIGKESVKEKGLNVVLVSGTTVGGMDITEQRFSEILEKGECPECITLHDCGCSTQLMAEYFGFFSDCTTISTACSSAANALILGSRLLETGKADIVVAGGSEALSAFHFNGFKSLMILDGQRCRPFDANRKGLNLGEGAAFVVMEKAELAEKRGAGVHAFLTGYGNACDAYHQTATSPEATGAFLAMTDALEMCGLKKEEIQYINAHGTGTPNNDTTESTAISRVFGEKLPYVSSTKPFTGHTTSASGSIEAVISIMALQNKFIPANLGWENACSDTITPSLGEEKVDVHNVMCNSFGFGGNDSVLIFSDKCEGGKESKAPVTPKSVKELARVRIAEECQLAEIKEYASPMESRRMGKMMKASILSTAKALKEAGINVPDAIITATSRGCLENSEKFALQVFSNTQQPPSPTLFMQSTHNTIATLIARRLGCHGYNMTYSQEGQSLEWAMRDARMLIENGQAEKVLVEFHDEMTDTLRIVLSNIQDVRILPRFESTAIVLSSC